MTNPTLTQTKEALFASLKDIKWQADIREDFTYVGNILDAYPEYDTPGYYSDIWENAQGIRIMTADHGNTHLSFIGDGSLEAIKARDEANQRIIAQPKYGVHFPKHPDFAFGHLHEIHIWSFPVATSTREGITISEFDCVFPHGSYQVDGALGLETEDMPQNTPLSGDLPNVGDTVVYINDSVLNPPDDVFNLGQGYTVVSIEKAGIRVEGQPELMFHLEYNTL